jgi:hypothetical protein
VLQDSNGNIIGVAQTQIDSIAPGQSVNFSMIYPVPLGTINPAVTELNAYGTR